MGNDCPVSEPTTGLEPVTSSLPRKCSTTELGGRCSWRRIDGAEFRAGDRIRTGDVQLGRLTLYQLSYTRVTGLFSILNSMFYVAFSAKLGFNRVEGDGFEPSKAVPADLQSAPFGHSGNPPQSCLYY